MGGAHNDLVMTALALVGVRAALADPPGDRAAAAALVAAAATKATAGLLLPFALLAARRRAAALAAAVTTALALGAVSLAAFGSGLAAYLAVLAEQGRSVSIYSVWLDLSRLAGYDSVPTGLRLVLTAAFLAALVACLLRTARGADWIAAAGWALLALLVFTTWLLPWYVVLLLPLAALGTSARLRIATVAFCALLLVTRLPLLLA